MTIAILSKSPAVFSKPQIFPIRKATLATLIVIAACFTITSSAQTLTTLVTLDAAQGSFGSIAPMIQNVDGNFYGTTEEGGTGNPGTVFKLTRKAP